MSYKTLINYDRNNLDTVILRSMVEDIKIYLDPIINHDTLRNNLVVYNYAIMLRKVIKLKNKHKDLIEKPDISEYFTVEETIGSCLLRRMRGTTSKKEKTKCADLLKIETDILRGKLKDVKANTHRYETKEELEARLDGYLDEEGIENIIKARELLDNNYDKVQDAHKELMEEMDKCYERARNKVIDINTRKPIK